MNEIQCLILSSSLDYSTDLICLELENRGIKFFRLNRDQFRVMGIAFFIDGPELIIKSEGRSFVFNNLLGNSIYFRAPTFSRTYTKTYSLEEQVYQSQWGAFIRNLIAFDEVKWVNNPVATYRAENKMYQLAKARQCRLLTPETLVTNDLSFVPQRQDHIVKSIDTAIFVTQDQEMFTYATALSNDELFSEDLHLAPVCIQEHLQDKVDIRVTFVEDSLFPFAILKNGKGISGDWRKTQKDLLEYVPISLPNDIEAGLQRLMKILDLRFGGIDLIQSNGQMYFIEVNPTGEWCWLQLSSGVPISKAITNCLTAVKKENSNA